jgi:hypothetical protein
MPYLDQPEEKTRHQRVGQLPTTPVGYFQSGAWFWPFVGFLAVVGVVRYFTFYHPEKRRRRPRPFVPLYRPGY